MRSALPTKDTASACIVGNSLPNTERWRNCQDLILCLLVLKPVCLACAYNAYYGGILLLLKSEGRPILPFAPKLLLCKLQG